MSNYERRWKENTKKPELSKLRRPVCMLLAFLTLVAIVVFVCILIIPQLADCVRVILAELPGFMMDVIDLAKEWKLFSPEVLSSLEAIDWNAQISKLLGFVTSGIGDVVGVVVSAVSSIFSLTPNAWAAS